MKTINTGRSVPGISENRILVCAILNNKHSYILVRYLGLQQILAQPFRGAAAASC